MLFSRTLQTLPALLALALPALFCAACADDAQVDVKVAPTYTPGPRAVSILGVFRDGRMSPESWPQIGVTVSSALGGLGQRACATGYGEDLSRDDAELYAQIDDMARAEGITPELLAKVAPKAEGDLVMILSMHGRAAIVTDDPTLPRSHHAPSPQQQRGPGGARHRPPASKAVGGGGLEIAAAFYDKKSGESVARVSVRAAGSNVDEALRKLAAEIDKIVPGATCRGWRWASAAPAR